jgi:outer membrane protein insertion porin family
LPILSDGQTINNYYEINTFYEYLPDLIGSASFFVNTSTSFGNDDVKISDRVYMPSKKLRGFEPGKVGPKDGDDFVGGNYATAINLASELPVLQSFENTGVKVFLDIANVWGIYDSSLDDSSKIRSSAGVSIDMFTPIGPLSFSLSQPITKKDTDKTESFRFNLGTTF